MRSWRGGEGKRGGSLSFQTLHPPGFRRFDLSFAFGSLSYQLFPSICSSSLPLSLLFAAFCCQCCRLFTFTSLLFSPTCEQVCPSRFSCVSNLNFRLSHAWFCSFLASIAVFSSWAYAGFRILASGLSSSHFSIVEVKTGHRVDFLLVFFLRGVSQDSFLDASPSLRILCAQFVPCAWWTMKTENMCCIVSAFVNSSDLC
jgi:hypothetical protein